MRESAIERALVRKVNRMGGLALKFVSPGMDGVPDRILLFHPGRIAFVELKAPGCKLRPLQGKRKRQLESLGFSVYRVDGTEQIDEVLHAIQSS